MRQEHAQHDSFEPTSGESIDTWRGILRTGLEALVDGRFDEAGSHFARAHARAPDRAETNFALGREWMRQQRFDQAEALLRAAWQRDDSLLSAAATLARCLGLHLGRCDEAHRVLDEAVDRHPGSGVAHVVRGELYLEQGRYDDAREAAQRAFSSADEGAERDSVRVAAGAVLARVHNHAGIEAVERGERDMALFLFKRAAHLDSGWSGPLVNMGAVLVDMRKLERARRVYRDAIRAEPENAIAHFNYGLLLRELGERELALEALHRTVELDPGLADPVLVLAELYTSAGDLGSAVRVLSRAVECQPDSADLWVGLGCALVDAGRRDDGEASLRQALDIAPNHARACAHLADLLAREGRYIEAAVMARRAQSLSESSDERVGRAGVIHPERV